MNIREAIETAKEGKKVFNPKRTDYYHQNIVWVYYKCLHGEYLTDAKTNTHFVDIFTKPNDLDEGWEISVDETEETIILDLIRDPLNDNLTVEELKKIARDNHTLSIIRNLHIK